MTTLPTLRTRASEPLAGLPDRAPPGSARRRIRMLIVITSTAGGAGQLVLSLAQHLSRDLFDLHVMFGPGYPLDREFDALGLPMTRVAFTRDFALGSMLRGFLQVWAELRRTRYDAVCATCSTAGMFGRLAAFLAGVPVRILIIQVYAALPGQSRLRRLVFGSVERALDRLTSAYVAVSDATKRYGVETGVLTGAKVTVIHNGVAVPSPSPDGVAALREDLGFAGHPVVGFTARLEEQKGPLIFIEAAESVLARMPEVRFAMFGEGPLLDACRDAIASRGLEGRVKLAGWRTDVGNMFGSIDVLCLSSLWEQFPLSILEAMTLGRPVVATDVDGIPEAVIDGVTGRLVPPRDPAALAAALLEVLGDPALARRMGDAGARRARDLFAMDGMIKKYEAFFLECCRASASAD